MKSVLIVEDIPATRDWLTGLVLHAYPDAQISTAASQRQALHNISHPVDLALIDLGLPDGNGLNVVTALRLAQPEALCVVTTIMGDDATIVAALSAGAGGYLLKDQPDALLIRHLLQVAAGIPPLSPAIARRIMQHFSRTGPAAPPDAGLTARETSVLGLIGRGLRNTEVAQELGLAESTVAGYIKEVYRKLGISSRAEAALHAARLGLAGGSAPKP
ncbi:MAG: response regulator [Roseinatronobacter sp.]